MTGSDDEVTAALASTLRHHAEQAPSADGLATKAMAGAARRRRRRINASIAAIVVLAVGIPVAVVATFDRDGGTSPAANPTWRWESYEGVEIQVPPDWEYDVYYTTWCVGVDEGKTRRVRPGVVGRPGPIIGVGCGTVELEYPPVNQRENWLAFNSRNYVGERTIDNGWVEETRRVKGVFITVLTDDDALRAAILDSAQPIVGVDRHGCPADHPLAEDPAGYRPDADNGGLPPAGTVESISVCRYALGSDAAHPLLSSGRITGEGAKKAVAAILSAPEGEGPDGEGADSVYDGDEIVVLRVDTDEDTDNGAREVVVRYSDESGNGFDDGKTKRELTADAIRSLLTGATRPQQFSLSVADLLDG